MKKGKLIMSMTGGALGLALPLLVLACGDNSNSSLRMERIKLSNFTTTSLSGKTFLEMARGTKTPFDKNLLGINYEAPSNFQLTFKKLKDSSIVEYTFKSKTSSESQTFAVNFTKSLIDQEQIEDTRQYLETIRTSSHVRDVFSSLKLEGENFNQAKESLGINSALLPHLANVKVSKNPDQVHVFYQINLPLSSSNLSVVFEKWPASPLAAKLQSELSMFQTTTLGSKEFRAAQLASTNFNHPLVSTKLGINFGINNLPNGITTFRVAKEANRDEITCWIEDISKKVTTFAIRFNNSVYDNKIIERNQTILQRATYSNHSERYFTNLAFDSNSSPWSTNELLQKLHLNANVGLDEGLGVKTSKQSNSKLVEYQLFYGNWNKSLSFQTDFARFKTISLEETTTNLHALNATRLSTSEFESATQSLAIFTHEIGQKLGLWTTSILQTIPRGFQLWVQKTQGRELTFFIFENSLVTSLNLHEPIQVTFDKFAITGNVDEQLVIDGGKFVGFTQSTFYQIADATSPTMAIANLQNLLKTYYWGKINPFENLSLSKVARGSQWDDETGRYNLEFEVLMPNQEWKKILIRATNILPILKFDSQTLTLHDDAYFYESNRDLYLINDEHDTQSYDPNLQTFTSTNRLAKTLVFEDQRGGKYAKDDQNNFFYTLPNQEIWIQAKDIKFYKNSFMFVDNQQQVFVFSELNLLYYFDNVSETFAIVENSPLITNGRNEVASSFLDSEGDLFIGTTSRGIYQWKPETKQFQWITSSPSGNGNVLFENQAGELFFANYDGVYRFNKFLHQFTKLQNSPHVQRKNQQRIITQSQDFVYLVDFENVVWRFDEQRNFTKVLALDFDQSIKNLHFWTSKLFVITEDENQLNKLYQIVLRNI